MVRFKNNGATRIENDGIWTTVRDGNWFCSASDAIKNVLKLFICRVNGKKPGVMIPIPQYPLYSATLSEFDIDQVGYYLDESKNWGLSLQELERSINEAKKQCNVRAIVVINPGNPTGQVLTKENIQEIVKFAQKEKLFILADEVYQHNIYDPNSQFHSFKKVRIFLLFLTFLSE
uniref:alanine transaminase n=1 Tax=Diabrotica virgifera virgifera TaxID=50390 RepID=A0A6P7FXB7_DIAVI